MYQSDSILPVERRCQPVDRLHHMDTSPACGMALGIKHKAKTVTELRLSSRTFVSHSPVVRLPR